MSDFDLATLPDLLARLDGPMPCHHQFAEIDGAQVPVAYNAPRLDRVASERAECLAAIRSLMAAVAAEREACAKVCDDTSKSKFGAGRWKVGAKVCAAAICALAEEIGGDE